MCVCVCVCSARRVCVCVCMPPRVSYTAYTSLCLCFSLPFAPPSFPLSLCLSLPFAPPSFHAQKTRWRDPREQERCHRAWGVSKCEGRSVRNVLCMHSVRGASMRVLFELLFAVNVCVPRCSRGIEHLHAHHQVHSFVFSLQVELSCVCVCI